MKTLDEVIVALEVCTSGYCSHPKHGDCPYLNERYDCDTRQRKLDALHYLKEYQRYQNTPSRNGHMALVDYFEESQKNEPLTWQELKSMEGMPVWVEWTKTEESYWCFVGEWFDDDEMRVYHIGRDYADYIHKTIYTPDIVQAYRKERG